MAYVNMSSIYNKIKAFSETDIGKEKMRDAIREKRKSGDGKTAFGSEILTTKRMAELAEELITVIRNTAASYDLAPSVMEHFDSLRYIVQDHGDDTFECDIYFADDLSRDSLETDYNPGDGIDNIIALFNNGYVASAPKYGWWNGHSPTGESLGHSLTGDESYAYVKGKQARPSLHFMQRSIDEFYSKYKNKYPLSVVLNDAVYDGNYAGSLNGFITKR